MLGAVPVVGLNGEHDRAFDFRVVTLDCQFGAEFWVILYVRHVGRGPEFQTVTSWVVHEDQRNAPVVVQIPDTDVLPVAPEVGKADRSFIENLKETLWPPAKLHVRPAILADGSHVERISGAYEFDLTIGEKIAVTGLLHPQVSLAGAVVLLRSLDAFGKSELGEILIHDSLRELSRRPTVC